MKRIIYILAALLMTVSATASPKKKAVLIETPASDSRIEYTGRILTEGSDVSYDWSGVYVRVRFNGPYLAMKCSDSKNCWFNLWIDKAMTPEADRKFLVSCKLFILSFCRNIVYLVRDCQSSYKESNELYQYINQIITGYHNTCHSIGLSVKTLPFMDSIQQPDPDDNPDFFLEEYYTSMRKVVAESSYVLPANFVYGFLSKSREDINRMLALSDKYAEFRRTYSDYLLNDDSLDLYDLYCDIFFRAQNNGADVSSIDAAITQIVDKMRQLPTVNQQLMAKRVFMTPPATACVAGVNGLFTDPCLFRGVRILSARRRTEPLLQG